MDKTEVSHQALEYWIDAQDRLITLSEGWDSVAHKVDAQHLLTANIINQSLWTFISDRALRFIYRLLVDRVRLRQLPVVLTARCDSSTERGLIEIKIQPEAARQIRFTSTFIQSESRPPVSLLDPTTPRTDKLLTMCSWCKRVEMPDGRWLEVEEAIPALKLFDAVTLPQLTHGMCVECVVSMKQEIARQT